LQDRSKNIPKPTHFGKNLKFLRRMRGLSQSALAGEIGMTRNNVASYESGLVEPNSAKFLRTCEYFSIDPKDMLESILSEHPTEVTTIDVEDQGVIDQHLTSQMDEFVIQTNEMTKVLEGYRALMQMRQESEQFQDNRELYSTLEDLLDLLGSLVHSNWGLIQSVVPDVEEE